MRAFVKPISRWSGAGLIAIAIVVGSTQSGWSQSTGFETVSVKPGREEHPRIQTQGATFSATGVSLRDLLVFAYRLQHESQLAGGPAWLDSARFDVRAQADRPPAGGTDGIRPLVRRLLEERFALRAHVEARQMDAFALRRVQSNAPLPASMQPTQSMCDGVSVEERQAKTREGWPPCGLARVENTPDPGGRGETLRVKRSANTMQDIATMLFVVVGKPVIDQTGLAGRYDVELSYVRPRPGAIQDGPLPEGPTLVVAIQEQLGLRVEEDRVPVPVLVIDGASMPMAD
jgi:uncharacterized protein (TIGR03435 family)